MNIHGGKHVHGAIRLPILHVHAAMLVLVSILCLHPATCLGSTGNETDRLALLEFKAQIILDPYGIFKSWNDSVHFCFWQGVTCSPQHQRVTSLNLRGLSLLGTISPHIGNLSSLRFVNLRNNRFEGELPQELGRLSRLRHLNLTNNTLGGEIPENISYCLELQIMDVTKNRLVGEIPPKLTFLKKLVTLMLPENNLTGEFPQSIGNMSSLRHISVALNNMNGNIPNELGQLTSLSFFAIGANNFTGTIPPALYNISSITLISTANNELNGSIPANIGFTLPNLVAFGIAGNQFYGTIPASLVNASYLEILDISANSFTGQVPTNLGYLTALQLLNVEENFLGRNMSEDLNFIPSLTNCSNLRSLAFDINNFGGTLPGAIGNFSTKFEELYLGNNQISGILPKEISNLVNVYVLALLENQFSGTIPSSFGKLENLQLLSLSGNYLSGEIPPSLGNITSLYSLDLSENLLEGNIPASLGSCQYLQTLDISSNNLIGDIPPQVIGLSSLTKILNLSENSLTGFLPQEIGKLKNIRALDVSGNKLSGQIPDALGKCLTLEMLYMQDNSLEGSIPSSVVSLVVLQYVDLSRNNLSGNIPEELGTLRFLEYLNLAFNNLEGPVPTKGVFSNASALSLVGNNHLCGGIAELQLPACTNKTKKYKPHKIAVLLPTISSIVLFLAIASICIHKQKKQRKNPSVLPFTAEKILRISYEEIFQATGGFSSHNLIGEGSFGSVYKGKLEQHEQLLVAVKVLKLQQYGASKSFLAECKALRNIRHRNLVQMLTYCSSTDFHGDEFKAIVLHFMENGSLEMWLHGPKESENNQSRLDLLQRIRISTEVASALHYLHDHCEIPIIHCDLKPSNILLDNDMTAKISDFGLSRLICRNNTNSSQFKSSTIGMKGTIGYMALEYGAGSEATTNGDVYSFGIILLEMFTGKRPTDEMFKDGLNLHNFVKAALPERVMEVVDPILLEELNSITTAASENAQTEIQEDTVLNTATTQTIRNCILSVLKIGIACSVETPRNRTNMRDVSRELNLLFNAFCNGGIRQDRPSIAQLIGD